MAIILQMVTVIGSFASMLGVVVVIDMRTPDEPWTVLQVVLTVLASIFMVIAVVLIVRNHLKTRPKSMRIGSKITEYMYNWIDHGGVAAILTRNMSWVNNERIKGLLRTKAQCKELFLCLPEETELSRELSQLGAKVYNFSELQYTPKSRFTIINKDRMDAQLAVGLSSGQRHVIEEFSEGKHPVFTIADDLINLIISFNKFKSQHGMEK